MTYLEAIILAIVEGITEYLPISSTGHLIICSAFMDIEKDDFVKTYNIAIQFGAIVSIIVLYFKRFIQTFQFYFRLLVAFIPAAVLGLILGDWLDELLENIFVVAIMLIVGGVFLVFIDKIFNKNNKPQEEVAKANLGNLSLRKAFNIGLFQLFALIPGTSRSAATIIGGMFQKLSRKEAAEFSFFLAVPTLFGATCYKLFKFYKDENQILEEQVTFLIIGNIIAFIVAMITVKLFIGLVTKYGFKYFGYYRIGLGILVLILGFYKF